jgi:hypothetical protein
MMKQNWIPNTYLPGGIDEGSFKGETLSPDPELVQPLDSVVSRIKEINPEFTIF